MSRTSGYRGYDHLLKLLLIGDMAVGKTSLLLKFCDDKFSTNLMSTIGIDFKIKTLEINGKKVKLQIWDTAGQEKYHTITTAYYRGSQGIMMVYDITNLQSFENINRWVKNINDYADDTAVKMIVANKIDMEFDEKRGRLISKNRGTELALNHDMDFIETSAKTGENIEQAFELLVRRILTQIENNKVDERRSQQGRIIEINAEKNNETNCC